MTKQAICRHLQEIGELKKPQRYVCEECIKTDSPWVHLRTCQHCGITLCCDSSPSRHMTRHYNATGHTVIISAEPRERWLWCYEDKIMIEYG